MTILLALLVSCNDTPGVGCDADTAASAEVLDCAGWCAEFDACTEQSYGVDACVEICELDAREADAWVACMGEAHAAWDVAMYGWDAAACDEIAVECGQVPGG